jgi:hypothetical protein
MLKYTELYFGSLVYMGVKRTVKVFESRVLRRLFGPKRDEVTWDWRKLHDEELYDTYSSPNIIRVIKSRRMEWAGHARMGETRGAYRFWWGNLRKRDHFEDLVLDGRIIITWILNQLGGRGLDLSGTEWGQVAGSCEGGNEPSDPIKCGEFLN